MILTILHGVAGAIHGWVPAGLTISLLIGIVGTAVQDANALFVCSGVVFGVAFAGLGVETWTSAD